MERTDIISSNNNAVVLSAIRAIFKDEPINDQICLISSWVYLDICHSKLFESVEFEYSISFKLIYIKATQVQTKRQRVIVPVTKYEPIDFNNLSKMQDEFGKIATGSEFYLAIVDTNSVILYYQCRNTFKDHLNSSASEAVENSNISE